MSTAEWRPLRVPIVLLAATLAAGAMLDWASLRLKQKSQTSWQAQQQAWSEVHTRYLSSDDAKAQIAQFLPAYRRLQQRGFIGEEPRVNWIARLRDIGLRHGLLPIGYDIGIRENVPLAGLNTGSFKLRKSAMKLHIPLLHEGDLLVLLQALPQESITPFILNSCDIAPVQITADSNAHLNADCEIDWFTIAEPPATKP